MADQKTTWEYSANDRLSAVLDKIDAKFSKVEGATQRAEGKMNRFFSGFAGGAFAINNATQIIDKIAQVIEATAGKALTLANNFEQTAISFQTITGSAAAGDALLGQLKELADTTLLANDATYKAGTTLLQFGVDQAAVLPLMKMFGDVSGGNSERLQSLALVFGQVSSAGRLMGQDLLQFINLGFNPLQQISQETGISMGELKKRMEDGAISVEMVEQAFVRATSEGGIFFEMMERQSKTLAGKTAVVQSTINNMLTDLATKYMPQMVVFMDSVGVFLSENKAAIFEFVSSIGTIVQFVTPLFTMLFKEFGFWLGLIAKAINFIADVGTRVKTIFAGVSAVIETLSQLVLGVANTIRGVFTAVWDGGELWRKGSADFEAGRAALMNKGIGGLYQDGVNKASIGTYEEREAERELFMQAQAELNAKPTGSNTDASVLPSASPFKSLGADVKGVSAGGKSVRNVNVSINKLVETLEVHATTINEGIKNAASLVKEEFIRATRDAEIALSANGD